MTELLGLPAHPLLVHAAVVLVPLIAVITIIVMLRPAWRVRFGWPVVIAVVVGQATIYVVNESGESFEQVVKLGEAIETHATLAESTAVLGFLFLLATTAAVFLARRRSRAASRSAEPGSAASPASTVAAAVSVLMGLLLIVWVFRTGHEGAEVVWNGVLPKD